MQKTTRPERRPPTTIPTRRTQHDAELVDEMDALLDEIDSVLEDQDILTTYRQRSGQ